LIHIGFLFGEIDAPRQHCFNHSIRIENILQTRNQTFNVSDRLFEMELLYRYRPILRLDSRERYFPSTFSQFLALSTLMIFHAPPTIILDEGEVTGENTLENEVEYKKLGKRLALRLPFEDHWRGDIHGRTSMLGDARLVINEEGKSPYAPRSWLPAAYWELRYIFLYPYNGAYRLFGMFDVGEHEGDIEHITVRVHNITGQIIEIFTSAHRDDEGQWFGASEFDLINGTHPILYIAVGSHAVYPRCGQFGRPEWKWVFPHERADGGGMIWFADEILPLMYSNEYIANTSISDQRTLLQSWKDARTFADITYTIIGDIAPLRGKPWWFEERDSRLPALVDFD